MSKENLDYIKEQSVACVGSGVWGSLGKVEGRRRFKVTLEFIYWQQLWISHHTYKQKRSHKKIKLINTEGAFVRWRNRSGSF